MEPTGGQSALASALPQMDSICIDVLLIPFIRSYALLIPVIISYSPLIPFIIGYSLLTPFILSYSCIFLYRLHSFGMFMRCKLSQTDIEKALQIPKERVTTDTAEAENALTTKVLKSANLAVDMSRLIQLNDAQKVPSDCNITKLQWTAPLASRTGEDASSTTKGASSSAQGSPAHMAAECVGTTFNWESRYAAWRAEVFANPNSITPNAQQSRVLDLVHERRLVEVAVENGQPIPEGSSCPDPLLRLIHGLPGSGILKWCGPGHWEPSLSSLPLSIRWPAIFRGLRCTAGVT